jgi:hypothetical protein
MNKSRTISLLLAIAGFLVVPHVSAQASGCKGNDEMAARLRAMGATGIQIEGCVESKPAVPASVQLAPPDQSKPFPSGESPAHYTAGIQAQVVGNYAAAAQAFRAGAEVGDPGCALNLSVMYEYGQAVPKDRQLAQAWLEKSIEDGRLLKQRAMRYNFPTFLDMAERGYRAGQYAAGVAYAERNDGANPTGNVERARLWLGKAAAQGHAGAVAVLKEMDTPRETATTNQGPKKYEEPDYMKRAAEARKAQNEANCARAAKGASVYCDRPRR